MLASRPPPPFTPSLAAMGKNSGGALGTGRNATELRIFLRRMKGRIITVEVQSNETVESVKKKIQIQGEEALPDRQPIPLPLFFAGKELKDGLSLADYSIHEHMLLVVLSDRASFVMKPPLMALARQYNKHTRRGYFYRPSKGSVPFKKTLHKNVGPDRHGAKKPENSKSPFQRQMTAIFSKKQAASCLLVSEMHSVANIGYLPKNEGYLPKNEDYLANPPAGPDRRGAKKPEKLKSPFQRQMTAIFSKKQAESCLLVSETHSVANIGYLPKRADVVHCKNEDYCEAYQPAFSQPHKCCVVESRKRIFEDNLFLGQKRGQKRAKIAYPSCSSPCCIGKCNVPQVDPMSQEQQHELGFACSPQLEQIFVKGFFGTISLQFNLENCALDLLNEVHQKIRFHASNHYLTCNHKILENHRALHEQGVSRNSHVYFNPRLHGGRKRLRRFLRKIGKFIASTALPDGGFYPELKDNGCLILTSLVHCVTSTLSCGKSWAGEFSLDSFDVDENFNVHVNDMEELVGVNEGRIKQNLRTLAQIIKETFQLGGRMPPYLSDLINILENDVPSGDMLDVDFRYIIDKHISLMPSKNRESLIMQVKCLWDSLTTDQRRKFDTEVLKSSINSNWWMLVAINPVFSITVNYAKNKGNPYANTNNGAFAFIRNFITHGPDNSQDRQNHIKRYDYDSGLEIMVYLAFGDFLASLLRKLYKKKLDVAKLLKYGLLRQY